MIDPQMHTNTNNEMTQLSESEILSRHLSQVQSQAYKVSEPSDRHVMPKNSNIYRKTLTLKDTFNNGKTESESGSRGANFSSPLDERSLVHLVPRE